MKKRMILSSMMLFAMAQPAVAKMFHGGESSGGGVSIVCRDSEGIKSAVALEIYEGSYQGLEMKAASGSVEADYHTLMLELRKSAQDTRDLRLEDYKFVQRILEEFEYTSDRLPPTGDTGPIPKFIPSGCSLEQTIIAKDKQWNFSVNKDIWRSLDSMSKAVFILHEALYRQYRLFGDENSSFRTRLIVTRAASTEGFKDSLDGAVQGQAVRCVAPESIRDGKSTSSDVIIFDDPKDPSSSVLLVTTYFGFQTVMQQKYHFPKFEVSKLEKQKIQTSNGKSIMALVVTNDEVNMDQSMYVGHGILDGEKFSIQYSYGKPFTISQLSMINKPIQIGYFTDCRVWDWIQ